MALCQGNMRPQDRRELADGAGDKITVITAHGVWAAYGGRGGSVG